MALVVGRQPGQKVMIDDHQGNKIEIQVLKDADNLLRLRIDAPKHMNIYREEVYEKYTS